MPYAELRHVDQRTERPTFEVWTEPWPGGTFEGPPDRNWDAFSASDDCATYWWRGGPDILEAYAAAVAEGRATPAQVLGDRRVSWWLNSTLEGHAHLLDEGAEDMDQEELCGLFLEGVHDGSIDIRASQGPFAYYDMEGGAYVGDAARALELPEWAQVESYEGGGVGSGYCGWLLILDEGRTLYDLERWLVGQRV